MLLRLLLKLKSNLLLLKSAAVFDRVLDGREVVNGGVGHGDDVAVGVYFDELGVRVDPDEAAPPGILADDIVDPGIGGEIVGP